MRNKREIRYLPCSSICHGKCEIVLISQIQQKNHLNLNPIGDKKGTKSIMINTLNDFLSSHYNTRKDYIRKNEELIKHDKKKMYNHKIFTIMDKDETSDKMFGDYISGKLFSLFWWGLEGYISPIYFCPNMDVIFTRHGFPIDKHRDKPGQYLKYLTTNYDGIIKMLMSLPMEESNIKDFLDYIAGFKKRK